ncbi:hypothetical protein [Blattabacterium cuenoti]|uniref:hypothetical protein n=1 Tax=Blattabacterium cuenoti TaxID=1653831 RepID=UPI00163CC9F3|nr:hypothetical protein [Blattabacterium cuenoti]
MNFIKNFIFSIFFIFLLCLIQILMINPLLIGYYGYYSYIYVLFILVYPYNRNKFLFLLLSFLIGWIIDNCMNSGGIHAFSSTLSAFLRVNFLRFLDGKRFLTNRNRFSIYKLSFIKTVLYIFLLVITHNFSLLILETFKETSFNKIILFRTIFSSIFTTILCIIYFFFRKIRS